MGPYGLEYVVASCGVEAKDHVWGLLQVPALTAGVSLASEDRGETCDKLSDQTRILPSIRDSG